MRTNGLATARAIHFAAQAACRASSEGTGHCDGSTRTSGSALRIGPVGRRERHPDVERDVQERVEVEQLGELEQVAHVAARRGIARRDLDRDAGEPQVGPEQIIAQMKRAELEVARAHPFGPGPVDADRQLSRRVGLVGDLDGPAVIRICSSSVKPRISPLAGR